MFHLIHQSKRGLGAALSYPQLSAIASLITGAMALTAPGEVSAWVFSWRGLLFRWPWEAHLTPQAQPLNPRELAADSPNTHNPISA